MHHDCIHAVGHGERLEVGLDGDRERQFVNEVHRCAGDNRTAAQILEAEDSVGPPEFLHPMPHQHDARELCEGFDDIEVAKGADLKESHAVFFCISPCLLCWNLPLESQVKPVAHQDPRNTWGMLINFPDPAVNTIKRPAVSDVIYKQDALCPSGVRPEDGAESPLP